MSTTPYLAPIEGDGRKTTYPIRRTTMHKFYVDARDSFWSPTEIQLDTDKLHYRDLLNDGERHLIKTVLGFFASMDGLVNDNIVERFAQDFDIYEVKMFYHFQVAMEDIHAEMYSLMLDTLVTDEHEKDSILNAVRDIPIISEIANWVNETISSNNSIGERLIRMVCIEGLLFIGSFCSIYWLQERGLMPGLAHSNELIARDESLHTTFAIYLYTQLQAEHKISTEQIYSIIKDAIDIATRFSEYALPKGLPMMNSKLMSNYLKFTADNNILNLLDIEPLYNEANCFGFMKKAVLTNKTLFFDRRVSEYSKAANDVESESESDSDSDSD